MLLHFDSVKDLTYSYYFCLVHRTLFGSQSNKVLTFITIDFSSQITSKLAN